MGLYDNGIINRIRERHSNGHEFQPKNQISIGTIKYMTSGKTRKTEMVQLPNYHEFCNWMLMEIARVVSIGGKVCQYASYLDMLDAANSGNELVIFQFRYNNKTYVTKLAENKAIKKANQPIPQESEIEVIIVG